MARSPAGPGYRLSPGEIERIEFTEKAVLACPLSGKYWIEFGRWNPVSMAVLAPLWSYQLSGTADHWWFIARTADHRYYYVAQFCTDNGKNHVTGAIFLGMLAAIAWGLQYADARWWYSRTWVPCQKVRRKADLDHLVMSVPTVRYPYSWVDNNCQHFAGYLYDPETEWSV